MVQYGIMFVLGHGTYMMASMNKVLIHLRSLSIRFAILGPWGDTLISHIWVSLGIVLNFRLG